jgi:hypothetical protein
MYIMETTHGLEKPGMAEKVNNPWAVDQLEDFLYFCCPECPDKSSTKANFIKHALVEHPHVNIRIVMFNNVSW